MPDRRLQVAVVLPESLASPIQGVRSQYDPVMAAKIPPHVTAAIALYRSLNFDAVGGCYMGYL